MTVKVNGKEFDTLKEAQDYAAELKVDPNYVPPVTPEVTTGIDLAAEGSDQTVTHDPELHSHGNEVEQPSAAPTDEVFPSDVEAVDTSDIADSLTDEDPELAEELDAALDEDADMKDGNEVPTELTDV